MVSTSTSIPPPLQEPELHSLTAVSEAVFQAAKCGKVVKLEILLRGQSPSILKAVLSESFESDDCTCTPLIIAARNGRDAVVKLLLEQYKDHVDIEHTGTIKFDECDAVGATALWSAAEAGQCKVVDILVRHGADINRPTVSGSTPLRAACYNGRLDIIKCLVENKAIINKPNKSGNTCIMIASYWANVDVLSYLIANGGDLDAVDNCGSTAMHTAASRGWLHTVKLLLGKSAVMLKNKLGLTPLMVACVSSRALVAEFLMSLPNVNKREKIQALELLGASYANVRYNSDITKTYHYLHQAMLERSTDDSYAKRSDEPNPAYGSVRECVTIEELQAIETDDFALQMEALIIRERILGQQNPDLLQPIILRGRLCANNFQFTRCIALWTHAMDLKQKANRPIHNEILHFVQLFSQMLFIGERIPFRSIYHILSSTFVELESWQKNLKSTSEPSEQDHIRTILDIDILNALYLLLLLSNHRFTNTEEQENQYKRLVYRYISSDPRTSNGCTPLHMAVNQLTPVDDFRMYGICFFPSYRLVRLLIECGSDPNATNDVGDTPLHVIVQYNRPISDFVTLHSIIVLLAKNGCHLDRTNNDGKTACEISTTGVAEIILLAHIKPSLKCIAARTVRKYNLQYKGLVPQELVTFIEIH